MKISQFLLPLLAQADGSGDEGDVLTACFGFTLDVNVGEDLSLRIHQFALEADLNDNDSDNVVFSELVYTLTNGFNFVVSGKVCVAEETTMTSGDFEAYARSETLRELAESGANANTTDKGVESLSCTDGMNGGCSHFCTDNMCSCPNCWTLEKDMRTCAPNDGEVKITCSAESMMLSINECVIEDNSGFELLDSSCTPSLNNGVWEVETALDECGTTFELDSDSQMVTFTNQLQAQPEVVNGLIFSRSLAMEFECQYGTAYDDVSNNRTILGGHVISSATAQKGTFGKGSLGFSLNFYTNSKFDSLIDPDSMIMVGETLFFSIEAAAGITGLVFTVLDCTVSDPILGAEYDILGAQCPDKFVGTKRNRLSDAIMLEFSYTAFQFQGTTGTETQEKLSCSVLVCDGSSGNGPCIDEPTCGSRRRRSDVEGQLFYVSQSFTIRK